MTGYRFTLTCPRCGGPVQHLTTGTPQLTSTRAITRCDRCRDDWLITITLTSLKPVADLPDQGGRPQAQCGTRGGYARHLRNGEPTCPECRTANARAKHDRRQARKQALSTCDPHARTFTVEP